MTLPVMSESEYYNTLHNDAMLVVDDHNSKYDIQFVNGDIVMATGLESLVNAVIIAIMTRFNELQRLDLYKDFGCKVHSNIKRNQTKLTMRKVKYETEEVLKNMRRIRKINYLTVENTAEGYYIEFSVTAMNDEVASGSVQI